MRIKMHVLGAIMTGALALSACAAPSPVVSPDKAPDRAGAQPTTTIVATEPVVMSDKTQGKVIAQPTLVVVATAPAAMSDTAQNEALAQPTPTIIAADPTPIPTGSMRPKADLPDLGAAREFAGIAQWHNSEPLTLASLRGKVVVVDFWTLGCINCRNTLPYVTGWYEKYRGQGLVVVGIHTPEFAYEQEAGAVKAAIAQHGIGYPVAQDNDFATWKAYRNRYWPAAYFVDAQGRIRHVQIGEGGYERAEQVIQQLLAEANGS